MFYLEFLRQTKYDKQETFTNMFNSHVKQVYNIAYRLSGNIEEAQGLTQEAFTHAFKSFDRLERGIFPEKWLYRIVTNLYIDQLRKKKKYSFQSLDENVETEEGRIERDIADLALSPEVMFEKAELQRQIQTRLLSLPLEYRAAVILADLQGFSYEEIAYILNCSIGTIRSRIHRGRKMLREKLGGYLGN